MCPEVRDGNAATGFSKRCGRRGGPLAAHCIAPATCRTPAADNPRVDVGVPLRWAHFLWIGFAHSISTSSDLYRSHSEGRRAFRAAGAGGDQIRAGD